MGGFQEIIAHFDLPDEQFTLIRDALRYVFTGCGDTYVKKSGTEEWVRLGLGTALNIVLWHVAHIGKASSNIDREFRDMTLSAIIGVLTLACVVPLFWRGQPWQAPLAFLLIPLPGVVGLHRGPFRSHAFVILLSKGAAANVKKDCHKKARKVTKGCPKIWDGQRLRQKDACRIQRRDLARPSRNQSGGTAGGAINVCVMNSQTSPGFTSVPPPFHVMRFLGRNTPTTTGRVPGYFQGQIISDLKHRPEGLRVKHSLNSNSIKMYDKEGSVLRIETTINKTEEFRVYRAKQGEPGGHGNGAWASCGGGHKCPRPPTGAISKRWPA